jgi:hypothetical protein
MSLVRMRRGARLVAVVLLVAAASALPHLPLDDEGCLAPAAKWSQQHDEWQAGVRSASDQPRDHCAVCHWNRTVRSPRASIVAAVAQIVPCLLVTETGWAVPPAPVLENLPARAPPQTLL